MLFISPFIIQIPALAEKFDFVSVEGSEFPA
jgi:hypothetical protein